MSDSISVVIPNWNGAGTIENAIRSCLRQTAQPKEVLVCDDGSTDNSEEIVRSIGSGIVRWLPGSRSGGPASPRNMGIKTSNGEWIAFLDSDDEWLEKKLESQLALASSLGCKACSTNALRRVNGKLMDSILLDRRQGRITIFDLLRMNEVVCSSMMIHRTIANRAGRFNVSPSLKAFEDYDYWLRIALFTDIAYVEKPLVIYSDMPHVSLRSKGIEQGKAVELIRLNLKRTVSLRLYDSRALNVLATIIREDTLAYLREKQGKVRRIAKRIVAFIFRNDTPTR
jgi:teichuronic acid biosynthesis glycosyltransferase TuaG